MSIEQLLDSGHQARAVWDFCPRLDLSCLYRPTRRTVRVISERRLREFWESRKHDASAAERDLAAWYKPARNAAWANFGALKQTFGSADQVGNCVVFDVGNNRYRLIARVNYARGIHYVLRMMDHAEYDLGLWVEDCGCHAPPPRKPPPAPKAPPRRTPAPGRRKGGR